MDARDRIGAVNENLWDDLVAALSISLVNPSYLVLQWNLKSEARYKMSAEAYQMAKSRNDYDGMLRAIMIMSKLDEQDFQLKEALGLIIPASELDDDEVDVTPEEEEAMRAKYERELDERILKTIAASREPSAAVDFDVLIAAESGGPSDQLGSASLAEDPAAGQLGHDCLPKGLTDGREHICDPMGDSPGEDWPMSQGHNLLASDRHPYK